MRGEGARVVLSFRIVGISSQLEADPGSGDKVRRAAQERAAREREPHIAAAQERMRELETERARREKTNKQEVARQKEPRASTTDAEARVMKMADSGFRPAYNTQIVAEPKSQLIVAVDIDTSGSDRGLARPAIEALRARGYRPSDYLVDGRVHQKRRYRVGAYGWYTIVVPAGTDQARHRSVCAEAGRQRGRS